MLPPAATLTLTTPDTTQIPLPSRRVTLLVDTGFSDYLQLDWDTLLSLNLQQHSLGTINSELADGSVVTDLLALVQVEIPERGISRVLRCICSPNYGEDLWLVGSCFRRECWAVIDYAKEQTVLSG